MSRFLNRQLRRLTPYTPGEQPRDRRYIKLNTNESPYPPSQAVLDALDAEAVANLRLYSDPESKFLKAKLAETYAVGENQVFVSNGSDEALNFAFMAYADRGVAFPDITYGFYPVFCDLYGFSPTVIPLKADFSISPEDYFGQKGLVVIANPNAPTGLTLSLEDIEAIVRKNPDSVVLVDEAYVDFGAQSAVSLTARYDNLLVVQTFSKSRSLAGARLGFAIGHADLIADLQTIQYSTNPYNINRLTQLAGVAALESDGYYKDNCKRIIQTRQKTAEELAKLGFLLTDSKANFLFAKHPRFAGKELYEKLKDSGILIRHFQKERISDYNRITVGSEEEMQALLAAIKTIIGGNV